MLLLIFSNFCEFPYGGPDFFFNWWIILAVWFYYDLHKRISTFSFPLLPLSSCVGLPPAAEQIHYLPPPISEKQSLSHQFP